MKGAVDDARNRTTHMGQNREQVQVQKMEELHGSTQRKDRKTCRCFSTT